MNNAFHVKITWKSTKTADSTQISHFDLVFHRVQRDGQIQVTIASFHQKITDFHERPLAKNYNPYLSSVETVFKVFTTEETQMSSHVHRPRSALHMKQYSTSSLSVCETLETCVLRPLYAYFRSVGFGRIYRVQREVLPSFYDRKDVWRCWERL